MTRRKDRRAMKRGNKFRKFVRWQAPLLSRVMSRVGKYQRLSAATASLLTRAVEQLVKESRDIGGA